ncbi:MAG: hypothetical protein GKR89_29115 [Candidatus Latescibacteria bacterium]|nr:hypothetical protein [Candidatus Latescibacterota bacterium]
MRVKLVAANLLALLLGLALLVAVEGGLALLGVGPSSRLFLPGEGSQSDQYRINAAATQRYFQESFQRHAAAAPPFAAIKSEGTVRVFALGASTLVGFPHPVTTSFPNFLAPMLADAFPGQRFELINCGITALSTFCLLDFADEILDYQPDLIVLYAGHNEFMGPYGVTTPFVRFGNDRTLIRLHMLLQRSRIYYFLKNLVAWFGAVGEKGEQPQRFGLHLARTEIGALDPGYAATVDNYRGNIEAIAAAAGQAGVPLVLGTLVSNLKDFHPLRSTCDSLGIGLEELQRRGRWRQVEQGVRSALRQAPYCANLHFALGQSQYQQGRYPQARAAFVQARDLDRLPFRAPAAFNQIVRDLARKGGDEVVLADIEATFERQSPHGIIGNELITEYVHPTVYGNYLIARTIVESLVDNPVAAPWAKTGVGVVQPFAAYRGQIDYPLDQEIDRRNDLMVFLRQMPYTRPPAALRRSLAVLLAAQIEAVGHLASEHRRVFVQRGGMRLLGRLYNFLLPEDRRALEGAWRQLEGGGQ